MSLLVLDGSFGEGGGQIVRTAVTLSCITGTPLRIENIRAGRKTPGLRAQHVTAIAAAAALCDAGTEGVEIGSQAIAFMPGGAIRPGEYTWAVGTAGAATLVLQTILLPLLLAPGASSVTIYGGTHVPHSPSGHYLRDVYAPMLLSLGAQFEVYMDTYGFVPEGGGSITARTEGRARLSGADLRARGLLERVIGTAVSCNLPAHIPQRIANRAINLLGSLDTEIDIRPVRTRSISTGAGLFLTLEYVNGRGGVGVLGRKGLSSEIVAEQAVTELLAFHDSAAAVDRHLADQLVLPLALSAGNSIVQVEEITPHLLTNIAVVRALLNRPIEVNERARTITFG